MTDIIEQINGAMNACPSEVTGWRGIMHDARAEIILLRAAMEVLKELHTLLDFDEPLTDEKPCLFEDTGSINEAFGKAYAVILANRAYEQLPVREG